MVLTDEISWDCKFKEQKTISVKTDVFGATGAHYTEGIGTIVALCNY